MKRKNGRPVRYRKALEESPSPAKMDGYLKLAGAICVQAARDLRSKDPARALDALAFFLAPDSEIMLAALGFEIRSGELLPDLVRWTRGIKAPK